jgi:hypothetical protein
MKVLWTLLKIALVCALAIPLSIFLLGTAISVLGALFGLAMVVLRIGIIGLVIYGGFRLFGLLFGGGKAKPQPQPQFVEMKELPRPDPYYESAMRDLDRELGDTRR